MSEQKIIVDLDDVDIGAIMEQIHANLAERGYNIDEIKRLSLGLPADDGGGGVAQVIATSSVAYWWQIPAGIGAKGKLRVFLNKIMRKLTFFYMKHVFDQQNNFNRAVASMLGELKDETSELSEENRALSSRIDDLQKSNKSLMAQIDKQKLFVDETMSKYLSQVSEIENMYADRQNRLDALLTANASRLRRIENNISASEMETSGEISVVDLDSEHKKESVHSFDYFLFESKYRGSADEIKARQERYLPYFLGQENILDIGCGRGEFLRLLADNDISSMGIDLLSENILCCEQLGVEAKLGDGIAYLAGCEDNSLGGIFSAQVIEHLTNEQLIELIQLAHKKLKTGAKLVLETLNPQCLMIYAESFYMDPSHTKPVHPYVVEFVAQCEGFTDSELIFLSPSDEGMKFPLDSSNVSSHRALETTNGILYGNREYALIATK